MSSPKERSYIPEQEFNLSDLEEEMATHSSILTWKISWTEKPGGLQSTGLQRVKQAEQLNAHAYI